MRATLNFYLAREILCREALNLLKNGEDPTFIPDFIARVFPIVIRWIDKNNLERKSMLKLIHSCCSICCDQFACCTHLNAPRSIQ